MVRVDTSEPLLDDPTPFKELELIEAIAQEAQRRGLSADMQPTVGVMRPDFIVRRSQLPLLVVEVKRELGTVHFAGISQVTAYGKTLEALSESPVHPVLVSTGESNDELASLAQTLGVSLISVHGLDLKHAAEKCVGLLIDLAEHQEEENPVPASASKELPAAISQLRNRLAHGERPDQISAAFKIEPSELKDIYMALLTKLEATEPDHLDTIMRAWERTD